MTSKYASEYPLPGGVDQYFNSLVTLLKRVSDAPPEQQHSEHCVTRVIRETYDAMQKAIDTGQPHQKRNDWM